MWLMTLMRSEKVQLWFLINANKLFVAAAAFGVIFVLIWGDASQWEYEEDKNHYSAFFSSIDSRISFVNYGYSGTSIRVVLNFDAEGLIPDDIKSITPKYKYLILERICNDLESLELLESGYYFDVDLRDISSEHMFKNYFNLIVKHERCVT